MRNAIKIISIAILLSASGAKTYASASKNFPITVPSITNVRPMPVLIVRTVQIQQPQQTVPAGIIRDPEALKFVQTLLSQVQTANSQRDEAIKERDEQKGQTEAWKELYNQEKKEVADALTDANGLRASADTDRIKAFDIQKQVSDEYKQNWQQAEQQLDKCRASKPKWLAAGILGGLLLPKLP